MVTPDNNYALVLNRQSGDMAVIRTIGIATDETVASRRPVHDDSRGLPPGERCREGRLGLHDPLRLLIPFHVRAAAERQDTHFRRDYAVVAEFDRAIQRLHSSGSRYADCDDAAERLPRPISYGRLPSPRPGRAFEERS